MEKTGKTMTKRRIARFIAGQVIPEGAKYMYSSGELDYNNSRMSWEPTPGIRGWLPIFGTETLYQRTPIVIVHYYEIEEKLK